MSESGLKPEPKSENGDEDNASSLKRTWSSMGLPLVPETSDAKKVKMADTEDKSEDQSKEDSEDFESWAMESDSDEDCEDIGLGLRYQGSEESLDSEEEYTFQTLSPQQISSIIQNLLDEARTVIGLPPSTLRVLLHHFKWDKDKLFEVYYSDGGPEKLFETAGIMNPIPKDEIHAPDPSNGVEDCDICFLSRPSASMYGLDCGHRFCVECWAEYLTTQIMVEGQSLHIGCPSPNCPYLVDDSAIERLVQNPNVKSRYHVLIINSFIQSNPLVKWCPSADCNQAIQVGWVEQKPVTCVCKHTFCFECGQDWHDPVKCERLKKWITQCEQDSATSNWIVMNTKDCPKCKFPIQKNGGCNHMTCRNCKTEFCWVCLGPWRKHDYYDCNRFDESKVKDLGGRADLKRFMFYSERYLIHQQSLKFENKLYDSAKVKMNELQENGMPWIETVFLNTAVDTLCQCRQTLMYTYAFAYYLQKGHNQTVIFEDNQRDLESAVEQLSGYLERDLTSEDLSNIRQNVQDKYRYCESRRLKLLKHVHDGYKQDWWMYNETKNP